jgi:hypothetical protein
MEQKVFENTRCSISAYGQRIACDMLAKIFQRLFAKF